jgi:hypothetical protein
MIENKEELDYIMIGLNDMVTGHPGQSGVALTSHLFAT